MISRLYICQSGRSVENLAYRAKCGVSLKLKLEVENITLKLEEK